MEDWIRNPLKRKNNASIIWKVGIYVFHLVGNSLIWQIEKGINCKLALNLGREKRYAHTPPSNDSGLKE
jgi:hypothetical protein